MRIVWLGLVIAAATLHSVAFGGEWKVTTVTDTMTDKRSFLATISSSDDHLIAIGRPDAAQSVWLSIIMPSDSARQFSPDRAPVIRVDKLPPHDFDGARSLTERGLVRHFIWAPQRVHAVIWHGVPSEGKGKIVEELRAGSELRVRYYSIGGTSHEFTVPLRGAAQAIDDALRRSAPR